MNRKQLLGYLFRSSSNDLQRILEQTTDDTYSKCCDYSITKIREKYPYLDTNILSDMQNYIEDSLIEIQRIAFEVGFDCASMIYSSENPFNTLENVDLNEG